MKTLLFLTIGLLLSAAGCFDDPGTDYNAVPSPPMPKAKLISPSDADALTKVLKIKGAQRISGEVPTLFHGYEMSASLDNFEVLSANGVTTPINITYDGVKGNLGGCYVKVDGASSYFSIPFQGQSGSSGTIPLDIGLPTNVDNGKFCILFWVYDTADNISNETRCCLSVMRVGTGSLQVSLAWDSDADLDLIVKAPLVNTLPYGHNTDPQEVPIHGTKDRSDADGYGPENIYWYSSAPSGTYKVIVEDHTGNGKPTNFNVTVSSLGTLKTFKSFTIHGNTVGTYFTKNGSQISF